MTQVDLGRALALVLVRFGAQLRGRLIRILPGPLRQGVPDMLEAAEDLPPGEMSFVEQVLYADLEAVLGEGEAEDRLLIEARPLRVSDLLALVLLHASPQQAAGALLALPPALQGEVLHKAAAQNWAALEGRLSRPEAALLKALDGAWDVPAREPDPAFAADILRSLQASGTVRRLLTEMYRLDPGATGEVQDLLYGFEELARLTDRELQTVLTGVDHWDLVLALRSASQGLRRRVLANISQRRAAYLVEDETVLEDMDDAQVRVVQDRIVERTRRLYEEGKVYTYFGSVEVGDEDAQSLLDPETVADILGRRHGRAAEPAADRGHLLRVGAGLLAGAAAVFLFMRLSGLQFAAPPSGSVRTARGALMRDAGAPQSGLKGERDRRFRRGSRAGSKVTRAMGEVVVVSGKSERPAGGEAVLPGDLVETSPGGRALVRLAEGTGQVQVEEDSALRMEEEGEDPAGRPRLSLRLGRIWVHVKHPALEVESPLAQVTASEGAVYRLRVVLDATTTVSVHRGTVWIEPLVRGESGSFVLGAGEEVRISPKGDVVFGEQDAAPEWLEMF